MFATGVGVGDGELDPAASGRRIEANAPAGFVVLTVAVIDNPGGAPELSANAGVIPATAGSDNVPAVPGTPTRVEIDEPGLTAAAGASGDGPLPPPQPAAMVAAKNAPTKITRRCKTTRDPSTNPREVRSYDR